MMDIILLVVGVSALGFYAGWKTREWVAQRIINKLIETASQLDVANELQSIPVEIEKEGNTFFVYNKENRAFLAQGQSHEEVHRILVERYPNQSFITDRAQAQKIGYIDESV